MFDHYAFQEGSGSGSEAPFMSMMLIKQLLFFGLLFSSFLSKVDASGCTCAMEKIVSNNPRRIPSRIPELYCRDTRTPCGSHQKVRSVVKVLSTSYLTFFSVFNWWTGWTWDTPRGARGSLFIGETSP